MADSEPIGVNLTAAESDPALDRTMITAEDIAF